MPEGAGCQGHLLHHGRADARCRAVLDQGRHPPDRHAPRAGCGLYGAGLFAGDAGAGRVHGGERPGDPEFRHRPRQRADRRLPGRRARRLEPDQPVRPPGVSGDRPGRGDEALRQIRRPRPQSEAHAAAGELRLSEGAERQAGPGLSRFPRRRALHDGRRRPRSIGAIAAGRSSGRAPMPSPRRSTRWSMRSARRASRSSSRAAVSCGRMPGTR